MTVPNKRILIEFTIKSKKTINYDKNLNELYSSNKLIFLCNKDISSEFNRFTKNNYIYN